MRSITKRYLLTLFLITFYLFSVKGTLGMPLLASLLDDGHSISVTSAHGDIHLNRHHTENHEPHVHHDNDFFDTHTGLIDTGHDHSEHESHFIDYAEDAIVKSETVESLPLSYPVYTLNITPVITTYRHSAAYLQAPPPLHLSSSHISTTVLLI
jgi:hypothetical protein